MRTAPLILLIVIFSLFACNSSEYISGKLEGNFKKDVKIYLIEPQTQQEVAATYFGKVIDSAQVNADGSFEFLNEQNR